MKLDKYNQLVELANERINVSYKNVMKCFYNLSDTNNIQA